MSLPGLPDTPCRNCTDRSAGCHAECEQYREWNILNRKRRRAISKKRAEEGALLETQAERKAKNIKAWRNGRFK